MSARSSLYENEILLAKPFQSSQSWHQLSVYENKILVQNFLQNEWILGIVAYTIFPFILIYWSKVWIQFLFSFLITMFLRISQFVLINLFKHIDFDMIVFRIVLDGVVKIATKSFLNNLKVERLDNSIFDYIISFILLICFKIRRHLIP